MSLAQRYTAVATLNGYEVIDTLTGHPQGYERATRAEANGIAQQLNLTAAHLHLAAAYDDVRAA